MRRSQRRTDTESAWQLLARARWVHLASTTPDGRPVLRVLNAALHEGWLLFHGAKAGEKSLCLGRDAVACAHEVVASVPSYFVDPLMACPATTYYRSVQAKGVLRDVSEPARKAAALQAFMQHQQPEGGHRPITAEDPAYAKELKGVRVFGLEVRELTGKESLGQDRPAERTRKVVEGLWRRGAPEDPRAIRTILDRSPAATPDWMQAPAPLAERGVRLIVSATQSELDQVPRLLRGRYWRLKATDDEMRTSHARSSAWVGALDRDGTLIGIGRGLGDGTARGTLYDVVVVEAFQNAGLGRSLMSLLLDHPALRGCEHLLLSTRDRMRFYEHFGFVAIEDSRTAAPGRVRMERRRHR